jgi:HAD superfamily hydrolase (TIGR01549 family)
MKLQDYKTIVFDCDGVILNSNKVKSDAFRTVAKNYGEDEAKKLVSYNKKNGGVSRYLKFQYFINEILHPDFKADKKITVESLAKQFSNHVVKGLRECELVANLDEFRKSTKSSSWMIISGGDEAELRKVFDIRGLSKFFDRGIFGSPTPKNEIFKREFKKGNIIRPALFIGDSKFDYECSKNLGIDFVFAYKWTEFNNWDDFCSKNHIKTIDFVTNL